MKILILEDDPERMIKFRRELIGHEITHFEHAKDCIDYLKEDNQVDLYLSDNDLGGTQMDYDPEDCGLVVCKYLCENKKDIKQIIVHSLNTPAARIMEEDYSKAGYNVSRIPFYLLKFE